MKNARLQVAHQRLQVLVEMNLEPLEAYWIDPSGASMALDLFEGFLPLLNLMTEMSHPGEYHGDMVFIRGGNDFFIA